MSSKVRTDCYFCHEKLILGISETAVHGYPKQSYVIKHEPRLKCPKCGDMFPAEPYQYEKTDAFIKFLESIHMKKSEIEYKDMIRYVDNVLKPDFDLRFLNLAGLRQGFFFEGCGLFDGYESLTLVLKNMSTSMK